MAIPCAAHAPFDKEVGHELAVQLQDRVIRCNPAIDLCHGHAYKSISAAAWIQGAEAQSRSITQQIYSGSMRIRQRISRLDGSIY